MKIRLINGPLNDHRIADLGTTPIRMPIYKGGKPIPGTLAGTAIYEFHNNDRSKAFWLENHWHGILIAPAL